MGQIFSTELDSHTGSGIKFWIVTEIKYENIETDDVITGHLSLEANVLLNSFQIEEILPKIQQETLDHNDNFLREKSLLRIKEICKTDLYLATYDPLGNLGRAAGTYKKLPQFLECKKAILNVKNTDSLCFKWSVLSDIHNLPRRQHPERASSYKQFEDELNFTGLAFPSRPKDVPKFEKLNSISINLFWFLDNEGKTRYLYYISSFNFLRQYDLLYFDNHYAWIRDFDKMMGDITQGHYKKLFCKKCFSHFRTIPVLESHMKNCQPYGQFHQVIKMPAKGSVVHFENIQNMLSVPYVIYADFESILAPCEKSKGAHTRLIQKHLPRSVGVKIASLNPEEIFPYQTFFGPNAVKDFLDYLQNIELTLLYKLDHPKPLVWNPELQQQFENETLCYLCKKNFDFSKNDKVRDHCHITGKFRGAVRARCHLPLRIMRKILFFS